ncbi:beta-lactamase/transpeptidase-like protein [Tanacetum coccineum]
MVYPFSGVESRLATLTIDKNDLITLGQLAEAYRLDPASTATPSSFTHNTIETLIPLCNTLNARRAIHLAANGHFSARAVARYYAALVDPTFPSKKIFTSSKAKLHDAFLGSGDYKDLILQNGMFGLRFKRVEATDGSVLGFGHAGLGGSTAYCDINNRFAISVTINKLSLGALTGEIIRFICSELDLPVPQDYAESRDFIEEPKIN